MDRIRTSFSVTSLGVALVAAALLLSAGCSGSDEANNKCAGVNCKFGVCNSSTGKCDNRKSCNVQTDCIPGYECTDGTCSKLNECSGDGDCDAGVCRDGACVNPKSCTQNSDCLPRTYCDTSAKKGDKGKCVPDPCNDVTCQRGTCKRGTDRCISKESCTEETEVVDCISGEKCAVTGDSGEGTCLGADEYCETISCGANGVCSFNASGCIDAKDCKGDDGNCLEGKFCNSQNRCQDNLCVLNDIQCERGVCDPATGQCENAENCSASEECDEGHLCVEGTCKLEESACGDAGGDGGCPGNQACTYDDEKLTATCEEPETCKSSRDCSKNRQCGGRFCLKPEMCSDDRYEDNDSSDNATDFGEASEQNSLEASACTGDTDIYTVNTADIAGPAQEGRLIVQVDVPGRERGLGKLNLTVTGPDGNEIGKTSTGARGAEPRARVTSTLGLADLGEYTVTVSAGEDMTQAGVNYRLSANLLPEPTAKACTDAPEIRVNQRVSGTTQGAESSDLESSCTSETENSPEKVYKLKVETPQEISFELKPQLSGADFSMSLRRACGQAGSEVACTNETDAGNNESFTTLLGKGTYYLIVQAAGEQATGGAFEVTTSRVFTACSSDDDYCTPDDNAHQCTTDGGRFQTIECDAGCNPSTGFCNPPAGDRCGTANTIDPKNAQQRTLKLNQLSNTYEIEADREGCLGDRNTRTGGADQTFKVQVPKQKGFTATVNFDNEVKGSLAMIKDCSDPSGTCEAGAVDSTEGDFKETLSVTNLTMKKKTYYLIIDTAAGQTATTALLDVQYRDVVCEPGMKQCSSSGNVEQCNEFGTDYEEVTTCGLGCNTGACTGDVCANAKLIPNDGNQHTYTFKMNNFKKDYDIDGASCMPSSFDESPGRDAVFKVDANKDDVISATWEHEDPTAYIVEDCSQLKNTCVSGNESFTTEPIDVQTQASSSQTYYIVADVDESSFTSYGEGTLKAQVKQPDCTPGNYSPICASSSEIQACTGVGITKAVQCVNQNCQNGLCQVCAGATDATSSARSGGASFSDQWTNGTNDLETDSTCGGSPGINTNDTDGRERIFKLDLQSGETVDATLSGDGDFSLYLKAESLCGTENTECLDAEEDEFDADATVSYTASSNRTVYLVAERERDSSGSFTLDITIN